MSIQNDLNDSLSINDELVIRKQYTLRLKTRITSGKLVNLHNFESILLYNFLI